MTSRVRRPVEVSERLRTAAKIRGHFPEIFSRNSGGTLDVLGARVGTITARLRYANIDMFRHANVVSPWHEVPVRIVFASAALQLLMGLVESLSDRLV